HVRMRIDDNRQQLRLVRPPHRHLELPPLGQQPHEAFANEQPVNNDCNVHWHGHEGSSGLDAKSMPENPGLTPHLATARPRPSRPRSAALRGSPPELLSSRCLSLFSSSVGIARGLWAAIRASPY